ncbi:MAG: alpha/beta hydrolase [Solirubrobacterales bacterium]
MKIIGIIWVVATLVAGSTAGPPRDEPPTKPPVLLMFHSGAFWLGSTESLRTAEALAREAGFKPVLAEYPLGHLSRAVKWSRSLADRYGRTGREVYAYGESAGGTLAALLAQRGEVRAAATYSPIVNVAAYTKSQDDPDYYAALIDAGYGEMRDASPTSYVGSTPILGLTPEGDYPVLHRTAKAWDARARNFRSVDVPGGHPSFETPADVYGANAERAMRWLVRQRDR